MDDVSTTVPLTLPVLICRVKVSPSSPVPSSTIPKVNEPVPLLIVKLPLVAEKSDADDVP